MNALPRTTILVRKSARILPHWFSGTALRRLASIDRRHQCDNGFRYPDLRAVDSPTASDGHFVLLAVDATDCAKESGKLMAVCLTEGSWPGLVLFEWV